MTGSVAAILLPQLCASLSEIGNVRVVLTSSAKHFVNSSDITLPIFTDEDEWTGGYERGQEVLHIELRKWADVMVIAPLSANTLAKLAHGHCDNLLTCVVRAWNMENPLVLAPAMNTNMWNHPATQEHLSMLKRWHGRKLFVAQPVSKRLACGDVGVGAMASVQDIRSLTYESLVPRLRTA